jgi:hypothetical protein
VVKLEPEHHFLLGQNKYAGLTNELGDLQLFPNPTTGILSIQMNSESFVNVESAKIFVADILGRIVFAEEKTFSGNSISLNLDKKIPNGIYLLTVQSGDYSAEKLFQLIK